MRSANASGRRISVRVANGYVLDAFALVAFLQDEPAASQVGSLLDDATNSIYVSAVNLGEVRYIIERRAGPVAAAAIEERFFGQADLSIEAASWGRIRAASGIKALGRMSYADAFAAQLAMELGVPLATGDLEFRPLEQGGQLQVLWLPRRN